MLTGVIRDNRGYMRPNGLGDNDIDPQTGKPFVWHNLEPFVAPPVGTWDPVRCKYLTQDDIDTIHRSMYFTWDPNYSTWTTCNNAPGKMILGAWRNAKIDPVWYASSDAVAWGKTWGENQPLVADAGDLTKDLAALHASQSRGPKDAAPYVATLMSMTSEDPVVAYGKVIDKYNTGQRNQILRSRQRPSLNEQFTAAGKIATFLGGTNREVEIEQFDALSPARAASDGIDTEIDYVALAPRVYGAWLAKNPGNGDSLLPGTLPLDAPAYISYKPMVKDLLKVLRDNNPAWTIYDLIGVNRSGMDSDYSVGQRLNLVPALQALGMPVPKSLLDPNAPSVVTDGKGFVLALIMPGGKLTYVTKTPISQFDTSRAVIDTNLSPQTPQTPQASYQPVATQPVPAAQAPNAANSVINTPASTALQPNNALVNAQTASDVSPLVTQTIAAQMNAAATTASQAKATAANATVANTTAPNAASVSSTQAITDWVSSNPLIAVAAAIAALMLLTKE